MVVVALVIVTVIVASPVSTATLQPLIAATPPVADWAHAGAAFASGTGATRPLWSPSAATQYVGAAAGGAASVIRANGATSPG